MEWSRQAKPEFLQNCRERTNSAWRLHFCTPMKMIQKGRKMETQLIENMNEKEKKEYIEFLLWHYRVMDSFWFIQTCPEGLNQFVQYRIICVGDIIGLGFMSIV